jgi:magnesium-transporting ATPase (P-type)
MLAIKNSVESGVKGSELTGLSDAVFTGMVVCNLGLILLSRAGKRSLRETLLTPNRPQVWVTVGSLGLLCIALSIPWVQRLFLFAPVPPVVLGVTIIAAFASIAVSNVVRRWNVG